MRKRNKKLTLNRETVSHLDLQQAAGAAITDTCPDVCQFSGRRTCTTCQLTCTTNLC